MEKIGSKIKAIRDFHNLSQERFGHKVGISGKTVSSYENNKSAPSLHVLEKIAEVYHVQLFELPKDQRSTIERDLEHMSEIIESLRKLFRDGLSL